MDQNDQLDIVDAFLAIHNALQTLGKGLPADEAVALQQDAQAILDACRNIIDREKARRTAGGGLLSGGR